MKVSKKAYLHVFTIIVLALGLLRLTTDIDEPKSPEEIAMADSLAVVNEASEAEEEEAKKENDVEEANTPNPTPNTQHPTPNPLASLPPDTRKHHKIFSVPDYDKAFPDSQSVQIVAAQKYGVKPVKDDKDAENRKDELVYIGSSPWYHVDRLSSSSPYLVPRAAVLLQDIGRAFYDSLDAKGVPLHKIITTSVLRTKANVQKLRTRNINATENSCHLYGTTMDICYNRYKTVQDPKGPKRREVTNDTLKWILCEVLRDMREQGRCYVKYEKKQGCFHLTTR
ncbi:MAG: hypothetical protein J5735_03785 [Prevotella sp.]|nr:hypothetical protein [Prevotella sp.]